MSASSLCWKLSEGNSGLSWGRGVRAEGAVLGEECTVLEWNSGIAGEPGVREVQGFLLVIFFPIKAALGFCHMQMSAVTQDRHLLLC